MAINAKIQRSTVPVPTSGRRGDAPTAVPPIGVDNVVIVSGRVRAEPLVRSLASDVTLLTFDLVSGSGAETKTVPVSWQGTARSLPKVAADDHVMVLGTVQRRFFRTGATTSHAVDVRAEVVARTPTARRKLLGTAIARLGQAG